MTLNSPTSKPAAAATFRSGAAARLAGIPVATLRMWERRYGVVAAPTGERAQRRYTVDDIGRLATIRLLIGFGHRIGALAHLPLATLHEMHAAEGAPAATPRPTKGRSVLSVALVGTALSVRAAAGPPSLQVTARCADVEQAEVALRGAAADLLAIEVPALRDETAATVDALATTVGARAAIVAYRCGTEGAAAALRRRGVVVLRAPLRLADLEWLGRAALGWHEAIPMPAPTPPPPRFDERTLAQLAQVSTAVRCECPRQVVDLLLSLGAFERYSSECGNVGPRDAELHRELARVAGTARALFEDALRRIAEAEGIELPAAAQS